MQRLSLWVRGNFFIPDPRVSWVRPSVRFLKRYLREHPVDAVVTTGPPQSMHLIGLGLKKALGVRWLADFRDPWTEIFYYKHLGLQASRARKVRRQQASPPGEAGARLRRHGNCGDSIRAGRLPAPHGHSGGSDNQRLRDFRRRTATPVALITNGFDEDDFAGRTPAHHEGRFTIVHTGLFAADGNPLNLWDALAGKCAEDPAFAAKLQIRLAGKTDAEIVEAIRSRGLGDKLVDLGYLPHDEVVAEQLGADVLILLVDLGYLPHDEVVAEQLGADVLILPLRREPEYAKVLPGKIFEYLASGRPVLGIGQEDGAAAEVLRDAGAGEMFGWDRRDGLHREIFPPRADGQTA